MQVTQALHAGDLVRKTQATQALKQETEVLTAEDPGFKHR